MAIEHFPRTSDRINVTLDEIAAFPARSDLSLPTRYGVDLVATSIGEIDTCLRSLWEGYQARPQWMFVPASVARKLWGILGVRPQPLPRARGVRARKRRVMHHLQRYYLHPRT